MIPEIQTRLRDAAGTPFALVSGITALAQVKDRPSALPAAYVYILNDASDPSSRMTGPVLQRTVADVAIVLVTENVSDPLGDAAADDLEQLKIFVRTQLLGFVPIAGIDPLEHVGGVVTRAIKGTVWFQDVFSAAYYQEETDV
jgi:hypothetical protein